MADFTRVVEFLRDIRQGPLQSVTDEMTQLAADYAQLCTQANDRLRQCSTFLQQGLRTEAIHLADESPNLLDLVAALDLPDGSAWAEFCQNNGLAVPPPLQLERAAQLNEAYAQDQPLEHLMAHHRLLALSRAPVRERLDTLRKIAQIDSAGTGAWEKDLRIFERARLKELPAAFHSAVKNRDNNAITALMDEVTRQAWYEAVPSDLTAGVTDAYWRVQRSAVEAQLQKLVEPLRDAFAARSVQECQALVQRWKNAMGQGGVTNVSADLMDEIKPVVAFIAEQTRRDDYHKRFRDSCKVFTVMLNEDASDKQLDAGYAKLKEFREEEIPEDLTRRYAAKKQGRRQVVERSHKTRLVAIASVAAGVIIIVLVVLFLMMHTGKAQDAAAKIDAFVNAHTKSAMESGGQYVESLGQSDAGLVREPNVAAAISRLQTEQSEYSGNQQTLAGLLKKADDARSVATPVLGNSAAAIGEIAAAADGLQKALNDISTAPDLAWVDVENKLPAARANLQSTLESLRQRTNGAAKAELEKITTALAAVPAATATPEAAAAAHEQIAQLRDQLAQVRSMPLLDESVVTPLTELSKTIAQRLAGAEVSRTVAEGLQNLRSHTDSAAELQGALEAFVSRFPQDGHSADFKEALAHMPLAAGIDAWQALALPIAKSPSAGNAANAQKRIDAISAFLAANPMLPMTDVANNYMEYLKRAIDAQSDKGAWQTGFNDLLANPLMSELGVMETSTGRKFYTLGEIEYTPRRINDRVSVSFKALDVKDLTKRTAVTVDSPETVPEKPTPAPHTRVVAEIAESLKGIGEGNWDTFGLDVVDRVAHADIDIVVKSVLILQALKTEEAVATWGKVAPLEGMYTKAIGDLQRQNPADMPWYDPPKISEPTRNSLKAIVGALPSSATARNKLAAARDAFGKALVLDIVGTGMALKNEGGEWAIETHAAALSGATVWVIQAATAAAAPASLVQVGSYNGSKYVLDPAAFKGVPEGSLVYVVRP